MDAGSDGETLVLENCVLPYLTENQAMLPSGGVTDPRKKPACEPNFLWVSAPWKRCGVRKTLATTYSGTGRAN